MNTFFIVMQVVISVILIGVILVQPGKTDGLSGFISGGATESFYSRNKSRTSEAMLSKTTVILAIIFAALCIVQNFIK